MHIDVRSAWPILVDGMRTEVLEGAPRGITVAQVLVMQKDRQKLEDAE